MPSFSQRNMFDVLEIENSVETYEEEELDDTPIESSSEATSTPLSKSAKKRAARQAKLAAAAAEEATSSAPPAPEATRTNGPKATQDEQPKADVKTANGNSRNSAKSSTVVEAPATPAVPATSDTAPSSQVSKEEKPTASVAVAEKPATSTTASIPSSSFSPVLHGDMPHRAGEALPVNRKRKTPEDFTPAGPREALTPMSPSKNIVKFEDGVLPGEGRDGERTIACSAKDAPKDALKNAPGGGAVAAEPKKNQNAIERTVWTFIMVGGFITLLLMGPPYMIILVEVCQTLVYKEVTALFDLRDQGKDKPKPGEKGDWSKTLNWYFFVVTNYFLYGESIIYYFKHIVFIDAYFIPFAKNHRFISFMLYVLGFVGFVANLQKQHLRRQFALFCWVHITLLMVVVSSHFIVNNILEGMIWFFVPASLVICNDVMAYVCGKLFGRTPLIKLSPKKTVEGFVGAFFCTLLFGLAWGTFWMRFPYMVCPAKDLGVNAFSAVTCKLNPVFVWREFEFTGPVRQILQTILGKAPPAIPYAPFQIHVLVMATFASLVAPFGGFFASGFKRAFNIKDFGHSIPGHGGMTDRMDCQFLMGLFAYVYFSSLIRIQQVSVGSVLQTAVVSLTMDEQVELFNDLKHYLNSQGIL